MKKILLISCISTLLFSCTQNQRAKSFGGTATVNLPLNTKLLTVSWKQDDLWLLTRKLTKNDSVEIYNFKEDSSFSLIEGDVIIIESK